MATTVVPATLKVTIGEKVTLNNKERGSENVHSIASITQFHERILSIPTTAAFGNVTDVELLDFSVALTGADPGTFITGKSAYIRITNLDATTEIILQFYMSSNSNDRYFVALPAGKTHLVTSMNMRTTDDATYVVDTDVTLSAISCFYETPPTNAVDLEIVVGETS